MSQEKTIQQKQKGNKKTEPFLFHYIKIVLLQKYKLGLLIRQLRSGSTQETAAKVRLKRLNKQNATLFLFLCFSRV